MTKLRISAVSPSVSYEELIASIVSATDISEAEAKAFTDWVKTQTPPIHTSSTSAEFVGKLAAVLESHGFAVEVHS